MKKKASSILVIICTLTFVGVIGCGNVNQEDYQESVEVSTTYGTNEGEVINTEGIERSETEGKGSENVSAESTNNESGTAVSVQEIEQDTTQLPSQSPEPFSRISLLMVGDILLHTPVEESAKRPEGGYDFNAIFSNVAEEIQKADLALVNQEVIIGGEELGISGYPAFNAPYEIGDALVTAGFDVVCQGTNHALDKGRKGLLNCQAYWEEKHPQVAVLGIHDSQEAQDSVYVYEQNGMKIAILNYTYGTNGIALPEDMPFAVDLLEEEKVTADIRKAEEIADFTIVCPHWGTEYELGISSQQEKWTEIFLKNGVDLVLGTHPHVIEPVEWVVEDETGHEMLVYYSLGNFVNWTSGTGAKVANRMVGGMAQVVLEQGEGGEVTITEYKVEPVVCHLEKGMDGVTVYFLEDYTVELAEKNEIVKQDAHFSLDYCVELCEKVWGKEEYDK